VISIIWCCFFDTIFSKM